MEVILLEKIRNLGDIGTKIVVKPGYARNYLIPFNKAVIANEANLAKFAKMREELENKAALALEQAKERALKLESIAQLTIPAKATEDNKLFGSVTPSMVKQALNDAGFEVAKSEIVMPQEAIRQIGEFEVTLLLHSDVAAKLKIEVVAA